MLIKLCGALLTVTTILFPVSASAQIGTAGLPQSRGNQTLLTELEQRIRDVRQGPDGLLYLTTDEAAGAVLRIEPAEIAP